MVAILETNTIIISHLLNWVLVIAGMLRVAVE